MHCTCVLMVLEQTSKHMMLVSSHATHHTKDCKHTACIHSTLCLGQTQSVDEANLSHISTPLHLGARVALCELPFSLVQTDTEGGLGGTCILRGCIPKKLLVYGGEFANEFKECEGYGYACCITTCCIHSHSSCTAKHTVMSCMLHHNLL